MPGPVAAGLRQLAQAGIRPTRWWVLGRDPSCETRVDDETVSPFHVLVFEAVPGRFWAMELGSSGGTRLTVYGHTRPLQGPWERIRPGDTLTIGRTALPWRDRR